MANAYSERANFIGPLSSSNHQLDMMVLGAKQQAYDANVAKVDSIIEAYGNIPLTRQKDKEALAANINTMLTQVNSLSKDKLADPNTIREINQVMKGALTPDILKHSAITVKKQQIDAMIAKKREKNDGTYSDGNYQDMLDQAGWESYINGETDDINDLRYNDYVDTNKIIREEVGKWAKEFGYDVEISESPTDIHGISIKSKTKKLSPEKINSFVESLVLTDPKMSTQLDINSRLSFRGMSDDQFRQMYEGSVKSYEDGAKAKILEAETYRDNYSEGSEEYNYYNERIKQIKAGVEDFKKPLNDGQFDRNRIQRQLYTDSLLRSISSNYAYERLESQDYSTTMFDAQVKMENLSINRERLNLEKGLDANGNPLNAGIVSEEIPNIEDEGTAVEQLRAGYQTSWEEVDAAIASIKGVEYSSLPEEERMKVVSTMADLASEYDINNSPIPSEVLAKVDQFNKEYGKYKEYRGEVTKSLTPVVQQLYDTMLGGGSEINLGNLSETMPKTAEMLRQGKTYDKLSEKERLLVGAEISKSSTEYLARNKEEREDWEILTDEYLKKLTPEERNNINKVTRSEYTTVSGVGRILLNHTLGAISNAGSGISELWHRATGNPLQADRISREKAESIRRIDKENKEIHAKTANPFNFIRPDRTIGDMQAGDIRQDAGIHTVYDRVLANHNDRFRIKRDNIKSVRKVNNVITYNPDVPQDKPIIQSINSVVRTAGYIPAPKGNYSVKIDNGNYVFTIDVERTVNNKKVVETVPVSIPEGRVPQVIKDQISIAPSRVTPSILGYKYRIPQTDEEKVNTVTRFANSFSSEIPRESIDNIYNGQVFTTKEDIRKMFEYKLNTPQKVQAFESLVSSQFNTKVHTFPSGKQVIELLVGGQTTGISKELAPGELSPYSGASWTTVLAEEYIKERLKKL